MITGKTKQGYEYSIEENRLSNWLFIKAMRMTTSDDAAEQLTGAIDMVKHLFGDKEDEFLLSLADENGIVPSELVMKTVMEIITDASEKNKETKN